MAEYFRWGRERRGLILAQVYIKGILCLFFFFKYCDVLRANAGFFSACYSFLGFILAFSFSPFYGKTTEVPVILNLAQAGNQEEVG